MIERLEILRACRPVFRPPVCEESVPQDEPTLHRKRKLHGSHNSVAASPLKELLRLLKTLRRDKRCRRIQAQERIERLPRLPVLLQHLADDIRGRCVIARVFSAPEERDRGTVPARNVRDLLRICGYHDLVENAASQRGLNAPGHDRLSGKRTDILFRDALAATPCSDNGNSGHKNPPVGTKRLRGEYPRRPQSPGQPRGTSSGITAYPSGSP